LWRISGLHGAVYEGLPGIMVGLIALGLPLCFRSSRPVVASISAD